MVARMLVHQWQEVCYIACVKKLCEEQDVVGKSMTSRSFYTQDVTATPSSRSVTGNVLAVYSCTCGACVSIVYPSVGSMPGNVSIVYPSVRSMPGNDASFYL